MPYTPPTSHLQRSQPWWMMQDQQWAEEHVMASHVDALYRFGEFVMFTLMWTSQDHERGVVELCDRCVLADPLSVGYENAGESDCPSCWGTSFEGGYRAQIIRPAIITDRDVETRQDVRAGEVTVETSLRLQTTSDFYARTGDYMFRADGSRYRVGQMETQVIRSGFQHPGQEQTVGGIIDSLTLETDVSSPGHRLPPSGPDLAQMLGRASTDRHLVTGTARFDEVRGPLVPTYV